MQALWWYPEKLLYFKLGSMLEGLNIDHGGHAEAGATKRDKK
jgi:hypothetical protein